MRASLLKEIERMRKEMVLLAVLAVATGAAADSPTNAPTLGPPPSDAEDIRRVFLRQSSMVLRPGLYEMETGVSYSREEREWSYAVSDVYRQFSFPFTIRAGLFPRVEAFLAMPMAYAYRKISDGTTVRSDDMFGFGDTTGGMSVQLKQRSESWPDIVGSVSVTAPTGDDRHDSDALLGLGSGYWKTAATLQFVSISDPLVLFWGFGYSHAFEETFLGVDTQPGDTISYNGGFAFAVNPDVSLNAQFLGSYIDHTEKDGEVGVTSLSSEPMSLRIGLTRRWKPDDYLEPYVEFGLNDDATDVIVGLALLNRFGGR